MSTAGEPALEVAPERVGVVADVDGDHRLVRDQRLIVSNTVAEVSPSPRSSAARFAFSARQLSVRTPTCALVGRGGFVPSQALAEPLGGDADLPPDRGRHGMELAEQQRVVSTWMIGMPGVDAGVVGERGAEHEQQVGLVHHRARDRGAGAPSTPAASG